MLRRGLRLAVVQRNGLVRPWDRADGVVQRSSLDDAERALALKLVLRPAVAEVPVAGIIQDRNALPEISG